MDPLVFRKRILFSAPESPTSAEAKLMRSLVANLRKLDDLGLADGYIRRAVLEKFSRETDLGDFEHIFNTSVIERIPQPSALDSPHAKEQVSPQPVALAVNEPPLNQAPIREPSSNEELGNLVQQPVAQFAPRVEAERSHSGIPKGYQVM